jgi:hypothetical protein
MKVCICIAVFILVASCTTKNVNKPVWLNAADTVFIPANSLQFKADGKNWKASLLTTSQPVSLLVSQTENGFSLSQNRKYGITEGKGWLCLNKEENYFYYAVTFINNLPTLVTPKDYRSPKTVNPDSGLLQQRIVHDIDKWCNLSLLKKQGTYFYEQQLSLPPQTAIYRAIEKEPLTSYYIQPGSCTVIPVKAVYNKQRNSYLVTAGPLKDKHNNIVANGTMVAFIYTDKTITSRTEAVLIDGYAETEIEANNDNPYFLKAHINDVASEEIKLIKK